MKIEDLAEVLGDQHGTTQADMERYLLELIDTIAAGEMQVCELFAISEVAILEPSRRGEQLLRERIAGQFLGAA